jgi:AcrR family transcriptional regulator
MGTTKSNTQKKKTRLSRRKWQELALDILIKEGNTKLRIDNLVRCMGVTKGSFYWHFKDRDDFILSLVEYWAKVSTLSVVEHMKQVQGNAEERLLELMQFIVINDLTRYDIAVRAWALMEPQVAHIVRKTDRRRLNFIRNMFAEMGFEGKEQEMRARTLIIFHAMEHGLLVKKAEEERLELMQLRHAMLTRPVSTG